MTEKSNKFMPVIMGISSVVSIAFSLFHLYTAGVRELPGMQQRLVHLTLGLILIFLIFPFIKGKGKGSRLIDLLFVISGAGAGGYLLVNQEDITFRLGITYYPDIIAGFIIIILVLEATRRVMGLALPVISLIALLYAFLGDQLPGILRHSGLDTVRIVSHLTLTTEGIFGIPLGASASLVAIFIIFAAFLNGTGTGQYFVNLVMSKFGRTRGGAAKAAVVGSGLMGMLSGSVIANVMGTGTFTIPLMKENGYDNKTAAAVEAVSSTGGQIMPPVMGAAAYIIAEILRVPFVSVIKAAIIPASLYYLAEFIYVDLQAVKLKLTGISSDKVQEYQMRAKGKHYLVLPIMMLIILMVALEWLPPKAAFYAILLTIVIGFIQRSNRLNWEKILVILKSGARNTIEVIVATSCAGIIVGVLSLTGLGIQLSSILVRLAGENLVILLVLTMFVSLIMGMGLTTTSCYIILAILVAPALVKMGVQPLAAHFFVFFFGMYSFITPPVALGAYAAAGLAGSEPFATGYTAWRIALPSFLVPYVFVFSPALLGMGAPLEVARVVGAASIGVWFIAISTVGFFRKNLLLWEKAVMFIAGVLLIETNFMTDAIGAILGMSLLLIRCRSRHASGGD